MSAATPPRALNYIDGEFHESAGGGWFDVYDPSDETVCGQAADANAEDVAAAVGAARRAFDQLDWSADHRFRQDCLRQLQDGLAKKISAIRDTVIAEAGTPASVVSITTEGAAAHMSYLIDLMSAFEWDAPSVSRTFAGMRSDLHIRYEPYGVAAAITPWNAPFFFNLNKLTHLLAAGNTVVLKTSPETPLSGYLLAQAVAEYTDIPHGVVNVLSSQSRADAGEALTGDPRVDMFHFTGSVAVGERIMQRAAVGIRKVCLELGGKSANIVLADADLDAAAQYGAQMCMSNSGQGCLLPTRMIVHESVYGEMIERLTEIIRSTPWGDPRDPVNVVGPLIRASQRDRVAGIVERARADGARILAGGRPGDRGGRGFWYEPTLVDAVTEGSEIAQTEIFGPVLTVLRYAGNDDEAVRVANSTPYGLSGYVQSRDTDRARAIANRLRAGTVQVGASFATSPATPSGGYGISGVGRECGVDGFKECLQSKTVSMPG